MLLCFYATDGHRVSQNVTGSGIATLQFFHTRTHAHICAHTFTHTKSNQFPFPPRQQQPAQFMTMQKQGSQKQTVRAEDSRWRNRHSGFHFDRVISAGLVRWPGIDADVVGVVSRGLRFERANLLVDIDHVRDA